MMTEYNCTESVQILHCHLLYLTIYLVEGYVFYLILNSLNLNSFTLYRGTLKDETFEHVHCAVLIMFSVYCTAAP